MSCTVEENWCETWGARNSLGAEDDLEQRCETRLVVRHRTAACGLRGGLAHFTTVIMHATSNEMEYNLTNFSMEKTLECSGLSLLGVEGKYSLDASSMSTVDSMRKMLKIMKFGMAH